MNIYAYLFQGYSYKYLTIIRLTPYPFPYPYLRYAYESQAGVEVRVARIFNTFGPRMHPNDGRVVSNFIIQVIICVYLSLC